MRRRLLILLLAVAALGVGVAVAQDSKEEGRIGPENRIQPSGRQLNPVGKMTPLGNLPTGGALTPDGRFLWTLSAGRGRNDIRIVEVEPSGRCKKGSAGKTCRAKLAARRGRVVQQIQMPGVTGGMVMAPDGQTAYVSGVPESGVDDQKEDASVPGKQGDVIHTFRLDAKTGTATRGDLIAVPPGPDNPPVQSFPPGTDRRSWPRDLAVSPDGKTLLAALNLGDRAAVIDTASKQVRYVQTGRYPYGAAITADGKRGLVSNEADGTVSVIDLAGASKVKDIQVGPHLSHPEGIAMDPKQPRAYVAVTHQDLIAVINTNTLEVERTMSVERPQGIGTAPVALDVTSDGCNLLSANSGEDAVAIFALTDDPACVRKAQAPAPRPKPRPRPRPNRPGKGPNGKPRGKARGRRGCRGGQQRTTGRLQRCRQSTGTTGRSAPSARTADRILQHEGRKGVDLSKSAKAEAAEFYGEEAEEAEEEKTAARPAQKNSRAFQLIGRIPVGSYPTFAAATPGRKSLVWIAAKGLGVGPNTGGTGTGGGAQPVIAEDAGSATAGQDPKFRFKYLPRNVFGASGVLAYPTDDAVRKLTPKASAQIRPVNDQPPPANTPIAAPDAPGGGKIEHVFYIVRENRTYDQILGDDPRGDGDPNLNLFDSKTTPNAHALARRFPLLDHVFANSEASIDGHFWTSAAAVSDYVVKNWHQNYADRKRPFDFGVYSVTWPSQRFLFDRAQCQGPANFPGCKPISYFNYGEAIAGTVPLNDIDRTPGETQEVVTKALKSDLGPVTPGPPPPAPENGPLGCFSNSASSGGTNVITRQDVYDSSRPAGALPANTESRFDCFRQHFERQVARNAVPKFNYLTLPNDHTNGTTPGQRTPQAMIAENDLALGEVVELISKSPIWGKSLIMVIEDDSQDGADHVDAHRIPAFVIGPHTRKGAVVHTRYDFLSFIRTLEIVIGMKPLNLFDATAVPMYDAFDSDPSDNSEPYEAITPEQSITTRNGPRAANARLSARLPLEYTDRTPQRILDRILWQSVHGADSEPPPPGPNASGLDEADWRRKGLPAAAAEGEASAREKLGLPPVEEE